MRLIRWSAPSLPPQALAMGGGRALALSGIPFSLLLLLRLVLCVPASAAPVWHLQTADTRAALTIQSDRPALLELTGVGSHRWNWATQPIVLSLPARLQLGDRTVLPVWRFVAAREDRSHGTRVTLAFQTTPAADHLPGEGLDLTESWWAAPGAGPIEMEWSLTNRTGERVRLEERDVVVSDGTLTPDGAATLWQFNRQSVNVKSDPDFNHGVFHDPLRRGLAIEGTISNDTVAGPYRLPFVIWDVDGTHGLYLGYESDFGRFSQGEARPPGALRSPVVRASAPGGRAPPMQRLAIHSRFYLWDSGSVVIAAGSTLPLPGMFYGCYDGDTDAGSNRMKQWFWQEKVPATLKQTPAEPLVEMNIATELRPINVNTYTEAVCKTWFATHPVAQWGVELTKLDAGWTKEWIGESWSWDPNPATWPDGMILGELAHRQGVKLALYLVCTYKHADLATAEGVRAEEQALLSRYDRWHFDFWRTDGELEPALNYLGHLGFLQVLDQAIAARPDFRWENCSCGGSKKSFDLLERQSMMTLEDSGGWFPSQAGLNYLKAYYANAYMICPVQMKDDNVDTPNYPPDPRMIDTIPWEKYTYRTGFLGAWMDGFGGQVYPEHVALYKSRQRPILRGADVYHLAALPFPDGQHWDGFEFYNSRLNRGSLVLLKPLSDAGASPRIFLKGLDPSGRYRLEFQDRKSLDPDYANVSGADLMGGGKGIAPFPGKAGDYDSEVVWIERFGG